MVFGNLSIGGKTGKKLLNHNDYKLLPHLHKTLETEKLIFGMQLQESVINLKVRQGHHLGVMEFINPLIMVNLGPLLKALYLEIQNPLIAIYNMALELLLDRTMGTYLQPAMDQYTAVKTRVQHGRLSLGRVKILILILLWHRLE